MKTNSHTSRWLVHLAAPALLSAVLAACAPAASNTAAPPPPTVSVELPRQLAVAEMHELIGRVEAMQSVDVRPRVSGQIVEIAFVEGGQVAKGDVLVRLDPRPFKAAVDRAQAALAKAKAEADLAGLEAQRATKLEAVAAMSKEDAQRRQAHAQVALAQVQAAEAALASAQLDLEFTTIRAPIAGRVGRADITVGNLVSADPGARPITTLVSGGPVYVAFDVSDALAGRLRGARPPATLRLSSASGEALDATAELAFADNRIGGGTGTLRVRAKAAAHPQLVPGAFVRVALSVGERGPALLVQDKAVGVDQDKRYVLVAGADGTVQYRGVELGSRHGDLRVIEKGLEPTDRVIVDGLAFARPGMKVLAEEATVQAAPAPGAKLAQGE